MKNNSNYNPPRVISLFVLIMLNVSIMSSLRNLPLIAEYGLSAITFFLIIAMTFLIPSALVSAELATGWPQSGGIYCWVSEAFGEFWGFFAVWMQWIHNISWYPAILSFIATTLAYIFDPSMATNKYFVITIVLVGFWSMTILNLLGMKTSSLFSMYGVILGTLLPGLFLIGLAILWLIQGNISHTPLTWNALIPDLSKPNNLVFLGGMFLSFAGLEVPSGYANEVKNPVRTYPIAIVCSALITSFLFLCGSLAIALVIPKENISLVSGVMESATLFLKLFKIGYLVPIFGLMLVLGAVAEINSWLIGPVKALHRATREGLLPKVFKKTNKKNVPQNLLLLQGFMVTVASLVFVTMPNLSSSYWILSGLSAQMYMIMYVIMFMAGIKLRYSHTHVKRQYKIPFGNFGMLFLGSLGIISSIFAFFLIFLPPEQISVGSLLFFESFLFFGLLTMVILPIIVFQFREREKN